MGALAKLLTYPQKFVAAFLLVLPELIKIIMFSSFMSLINKKTRPDLEECSVCLSEIDELDEACKHVFHANCLEKWMKTLRINSNLQSTSQYPQSASEWVKLQKLTDSDSGILEVNLERPQVKNAIGKEMLRGLQYTFEAVERDRRAKVLMICSSVPKVFCAGADLKERMRMSPSEVEDFVNSLRSTFCYLEGLCIPTIAVIEGAALGGGLEMALSCDLRICGEDAVLGLPETGLAIIPGAGGTQRLPRLVGKSKAKELIFTGRNITVSIGLVNYCVPPGQARNKALQIARHINQNGPLAIRMAKRAIDGGLDGDMASGLALEEQCYQQTLHSKDRLEGLAAFAHTRIPNYTGQ